MKRCLLPRHNHRHSQPIPPILTIRMSCFFAAFVTDQTNLAIDIIDEWSTHKSNLSFSFEKVKLQHQSLLVCSRYLHLEVGVLSIYSTSKNNRCPWNEKIQNESFQGQVIAHKDNPIDFWKESKNQLSKLPFHHPHHYLLAQCYTCTFQSNVVNSLASVEK